jgi:hypothetical protein
MQKNEH